MIMCIQNLVKFCQFILKIWSKNLIFESIKGRNSVANLRKHQFTLLTLILSMMMCIQNLVLFCQFVLKILSKNQILTSIKGRWSRGQICNFEHRCTPREVKFHCCHVFGIHLWCLKNHVVLSYRWSFFHNELVKCVTLQTIKICDKNVLHN